MPPLVALVPSPFLGAATWRPVADALSARGHDTLAVPGPATAPRTAEDVLAGMLTALPAERALVLVPHSGAGLYVPSLVARRRVVAVVLVDAALPPARGQVPVAPPALRERVAAKARSDGRLPPWTGWWDEDVSWLFPDAATQRAVEREQQRLPVSYLQQQVEVPAGWDALPCAYLSFGDTYGEERAQAAERGWPVQVLDGHHLHMLVDPAGVAAAVDRLLGGLDPASS